jgi:hypothetical protein
MDQFSDEERKQLNEAIETADHLRSLLQHPGWTKVLEPRLKELRERLIGEMLHKQLDFNGFLLSQQSVQAVDTILGGIDLAIAEGEEAQEKLKEGDD